MSALRKVRSYMGTRAISHKPMLVDDEVQRDCRADSDSRWLDCLALLMVLALGVFPFVVRYLPTTIRQFLGVLFY